MVEATGRALLFPPQRPEMKVPLAAAAALNGMLLLLLADLERVRVHTSVPPARDAVVRYYYRSRSPTESAAHHSSVMM
jgi:hypothetical protein